MHHPSTRSRAALAALAVSSTLLLAACGSDTKPATEEEEATAFGGTLLLHAPYY